MTEWRVEVGLERLPEAAAVREEVFVKEQGYRQEFDGTDAGAVHAVLYEASVPVAAGRTFPSGRGREWVIGRVAVRLAHRGKGYGRLMVRRLEEEAVARGAQSLWLLAQRDKQPFYEKLGYTAVGESVRDEDVPHVPMRRAILEKRFKSFDKPMQK